MPELDHALPIAINVGTLYRGALLQSCRDEGAWGLALERYAASALPDGGIPTFALTEVPAEHTLRIRAGLRGPASVRRWTSR